MLKTCCLNLDISIVNLSNSSSTVSFSSFFCCYCEFLLNISYYSFSFMFCHLNQDTASVLSIPSNCTLISTHFWQHPYMQTMFSVSHVYNSIISCKLAVFQSFLFVHSVNNVLKVVMLLANACLSVRISRTGNPKWFASQKASIWLILMSGFSTTNFW